METSAWVSSLLCDPGPAPNCSELSLLSVDQGQSHLHRGGGDRVYKTSAMGGDEEQLLSAVEIQVSGGRFPLLPSLTLDGWLDYTAEGGWGLGAGAVSL